MKLTIELVPATTWGANLRERLGSTRWRQLSARVRSGDKCQICGATSGRMDCHEVWSYDDKTHVQKLMELQCICYDCHLVKHFGRSTMMGQLGRVMEHLMKVNQIGRLEAMCYIDVVNKTWEERSKIYWTLDLGDL